MGDTVYLLYSAYTQLFFTIWIVQTYFPISWLKEYDFKFETITRFVFLLVLWFNKRSQQKVFYCLFRIAYTKYCQLKDCCYMYSKWICTLNMSLPRSLTAELVLLPSKYFTQVWLAWRQGEPFWLIAELAQILPSLAHWLYLRAFSGANSSLRSCLTAAPRCSLLGQLQLEFFFSLCAGGPAWRGCTRLTKSDSLNRVNEWRLTL